MSSPCPKELPSNCALAPALATQAAEESVETILAKRATDTRSTTIMIIITNGKHYRHPQGKHHHGKHHHGKHHHDKEHGHGHSHGHGHHGHHGYHGGGNRHPFKDHCVAVGDFCGPKLYKCDFGAKTHYRCAAISERPVVVLADTKICSGTIEPPGPKDCTCPDDGKGSVRSSQLSAACKAKEK
ncbi:hypothetical protein BGZ47_004981 [Haplosporangium gracile]|nr:hypothetical protein BGZ47_004981 [Haplosporangium gracile]